MILILMRVLVFLALAINVRTRPHYHQADQVWIHTEMPFGPTRAIVWRDGRLIDFSTIDYMQWYSTGTAFYSPGVAIENTTVITTSGDSDHDPVSLYRDHQPEVDIPGGIWQNR